jgi:NAD-dependent DNA ligase
MTKEELINRIKEANSAYRKGEAIMSDEEYDELLDELSLIDPDHQILDKIGFDVGEDDDRKEPLPIPMASMNKVKTIEEIEAWFKSKELDPSTEIVLTPKYDGISLCVEEARNKAWTRGNGVEGQRSDEHLKLIDRTQITAEDGIFTYGELIMTRQAFDKEYKEDFSNPRNLVAGQINQKKPGPKLEDCDFVAYGLYGKEFPSKRELLDFLNATQKNKVPYEIKLIGELTADNLKETFQKWSENYELDGVILELNDLQLCKALGRETNNNPAFARAYKGGFEEVKETVVEAINWSISKQGYLKPVIQVDTIKLDGGNVTNVTGNNARFVKNLELGKGSVIKVKRSGMVIPKLVEVIEATGFEFPVIDGVELEWNESGTELMTSTVTPEQQFRSLLSFFEILEVDFLGEGTLRTFFEAGYDSPAKVLRMTKEQMASFEGFGERKAQNILDAIAKKKEIPRSRLQHASGFFRNLGSKKLLLLEHLDENATVEQIEAIEGFSEILARNFLKGIVKFNEWVQELDGLIKITVTEVVEPTSSELEGQTFVFTGVRRKDLEEIITDKGGKIGSDVNSKTTYLIMKEIGSGSSKEKKAQKLNKTIITVEELEGMLV